MPDTCLTPEAQRRGGFRPARDLQARPLPGASALKANSGRRRLLTGPL